MKDEPPILTHEYDGIQEYDNPLPGWWTGIFVITIVFAAGYWFWYHGGGPGQSPQARFEQDWREYSTEKAMRDKTAKLDVTEELLASLAADQSALDAGGKIFEQSCAGCHLADGSGQIGPNLTDEFQIHGASRLDIYRTIHDGVPDKGMVTWSQSMQDRDMAAVAAYVATMRGRNLPGKAAEGEKVGTF
jgi:cytochrome c oxidase cbb3-type subunit 3